MTSSTKTDRMYFQSSSNREVKELQSMLSSMQTDQQKDAMKQIIASMTIGKDVSNLFPNVINCMRTTSIELKKLIYLYIIHYSKIKPDLTILGVAAFTSDARDNESPLIRGLAVRTMGCIHVDVIVSYLAEIIRISLKDNDPYVRKTAAICVAKLYSTNPGLVQENGFIESLHSLLYTDNNVSVIANALSALNEMSLRGEETALKKIKSKTISKIISMMHEGNEWCQVSILDALPNIEIKYKQYEEVIEGVLPRLSHLNASVAMSALKVILKFLDNIDNYDKVKFIGKKITNCLITLMNSGSEIQYVLLRSLLPIMQKRPMLLDKDYKAFYIKYNDPIYVKMEKVEILYHLCDNSNFESILYELKSYALTEFDSELIKKAIRYLGLIGIKYEKCIDICVDFIINVFENDNAGETSLNEVCLISRELIRKYKGRTLEIIPKIAKADLIINTITDSKAQSALIYLIGEFCTFIEKSTEIITELIEANLINENVRLQVLTAAVKNYVCKPDEAEEIVKICLKKGAEESSDPDVRDRAYLYWRLLEVDPDLAKEMLTTTKPGFDLEEDDLFDGDVCDNLIENLTNVSCIYHVVSSKINSNETEIKKDSSNDKEKEKEKKEMKEIMQKVANDIEAKKPSSKQNIIKQNQGDIDLLGLDEGIDMETNKVDIPKNTVNPMSDIFGVFNSTTNNQNVIKTEPPQIMVNNINPIMSAMDFEFSPEDNDEPPFDESSIQVEIFDKTIGTSPSPNTKIFTDTDYTIYSSSHRQEGKIYLGFFVISKKETEVEEKEALLFIEKNSFGLKSAQPPKVTKLSQNSQKLIFEVVLAEDNLSTAPPSSPFNLQCTLSLSNKKISLSPIFMINNLFVDGYKMVNAPFVQFYQENTTKAFNQEVILYHSNEEEIRGKFARNNINFSAKTKSNPPLTYYSGNVGGKIEFLIESSVNVLNTSQVKIRVITSIECVLPLVKESIDLIIQS